MDQSYPCLELVIDQGRGQESSVIDAVNETLNTLEQHGCLTGWTWKATDARLAAMKAEADKVATETIGYVRRINDKLGTAITDEEILETVTRTINAANVPDPEFADEIVRAASRMLGH